MLHASKFWSKIGDFGLFLASWLFRKINKIVATRCHILRLKCTKFNFGWGSAPDPAGGAYSAPPDPLPEFKGAYILREGREREGREGREREGREKERRGKGEGPLVLDYTPWREILDKTLFYAVQCEIRTVCVIAVTHLKKVVNALFDSLKQSHSLVWSIVK